MSKKYDAVIVLACGINEDGTLPSDPVDSVDIATGLYEKHQTDIIIFSGSLSYKATIKPPRSESEAMYDYAQSNGLPKNSLLVENESKDTLGNAYFTKTTILIPRHLANIAVVLGPNHSLERVEYIFKKVLGDSYDVTFFEHNVNRSGEAERELESLSILKGWLNEISDGDHEEVYKVMLNRHPGYRQTVTN